MWVGLAAVLAPVWVWLVRASLDMYGDMTGASAWMMRASWDAPFTALVFAMWSAMMVGMMLPSAAPAVLIFARVARSGPEPDRPVLRAYLFAAGYLLVWTAFSAAATALQAMLARAALLTPMMESATPYLAAGVLLVAGLYQWSSVKRACLGALPHARAVARRELARRRGGRAAHGHRARRLLRRLLLGADAALVRGRRDEPAGDRGALRLRAPREARAVRPARRSRGRSRAGRRRARGSRCGAYSAPELAAGAAFASRSSSRIAVSISP